MARTLFSGPDGKRGWVDVELGGDLLMLPCRTPDVLKPPKSRKVELLDTFRQRECSAAIGSEEHVPALEPTSQHCSSEPGTEEKIGWVCLSEMAVWKCVCGYLRTRINPQYISSVWRWVAIGLLNLNTAWCLSIWDCRSSNSIIDVSENDGRKPAS